MVACLFIPCIYGSTFLQKDSLLKFKHGLDLFFLSSSPISKESRVVLLCDNNGVCSPIWHTYLLLHINSSFFLKKKDWWQFSRGHDVFFLLYCVFSMCCMLSLLGEIIFLFHHCVSFSAFLAHLGCFPLYKPLNNSQIQPSLVTILKSQIKWCCQLNKLSSLKKKKKRINRHLEESFISWEESVGFSQRSHGI